MLRPAERIRDPVGALGRLFATRSKARRRALQTSALREAVPSLLMTVLQVSSKAQAITIGGEACINAIIFDRMVSR